MFGTKTVDSILSSITTAISQLDRFAINERDTAQTESDKANTLYQSAEARRQEASRASVVAGKLNKLISV